MCLLWQNRSPLTSLPSLFLFPILIFETFSGCQSREAKKVFLNVNDDAAANSVVTHQSSLGWPAGVSCLMDEQLAPTVFNILNIGNDTFIKMHHRVVVVSPLQTRRRHPKGIQPRPLPRRMPIPTLLNLANPSPAQSPLPASIPVRWNQPVSTPSVRIRRMLQYPPNPPHRRQRTLETPPVTVFFK